jgi:calcineurin-like phosphoesterase family protein
MREVKFRDDIDPENTWVVSDTHFGHANIVGFCHRPEDHEQVMLAEWRKWVPDDATVLHLGDLSYRSNSWFKNIIAKELTGARKLLIQGNHDNQRFSFYKQSGFQLVRPFSIEYPGDLTPGVTRPWNVSFAHYPWNEEEDGEIRSNDLRVHGHIHNNGYTRDAFVPFLKQHINLSVEQTHYRPVNLKLLLDGALGGKYPQTTPEQIKDARDRKHEAMAKGQAG